MNQHEQRPTRVTTVGISNRQNSLLQHFFAEHCDGDFQLVSEESAELLIIDIDQAVGSQRYNRLNGGTNAPIMILLSLNHQGEADDEANGLYRIKKPLQSESLRKTLTHARLRSHQQALQQPPVVHHDEEQATIHHAAEVIDIQEAHAYIGSAPDIDPADPSQYSQAFHDPAHYLVGHILGAISEARQTHHPHLIESSRGAILIAPHGTTLVSTINGAQLRTLATFPDVQLSLRPLERGELFAEGEKVEQFDRDEFIWRTALWAARGRVPVDADLNTPVYLSRWPNFTRLQLFPHALQIAALWRRQPHTLLESAKQLGIAQRYVFALYSATNAIGLSGLCRRDSDTLFEREAIPAHSLRGLFGRLVSHLRSEPEQLKERA